MCRSSSLSMSLTMSSLLLPFSISTYCIYCLLPKKTIYHYHCYEKIYAVDKIHWYTCKVQSDKKLCSTNIKNTKMYKFIMR